MSKSGSRYGRRSNWFKIHCLLQEQQEAKNSIAYNVSQKAQSFSPSLHPFYSSNLLSRVPYSDDKMTMLRFNEHFKKPETSSPSVSSPESLTNSDNDSLVAMMEHNDPRPSPTINKDYFSTMSFQGYPMIPGFLPPTSHFLLSSYQNALQEHNHHFLRHQGQDLLKIAGYPPAFPEKTKIINTDEEKIFEKTLKRKSSSSPEGLSLPKLQKRSSSPAENGDSDIEVNENDDVLTPPCSPKCLDNNPIDLSNKASNNVESDSLSRGRNVQETFRKIHLSREFSTEKLLENGGDHTIAPLSLTVNRVDVRRDSSAESLAFVAPLDLTSKAWNFKHFVSSL